MGIYALCLGASSYLSPIMCGFINDGQGYQWVFYYFSIFLAVAFFFLFFFMEETNYDRKTVGVIEDTALTETPTSQPGLDEEKGPEAGTAPASTTDISTGTAYSRKTFWQKLSLKDTSRPNRFFQRMRQQLVFLTWPVIFYAG